MWDLQDVRPNGQGPVEPLFTECIGGRRDRNLVMSAISVRGNHLHIFLLGHGTMGWPTHE